MAAAAQQLAEFGAERSDFVSLLAEAAVAAVVQHGQWVDRAVEGQLAPQFAVDVIGPLVGNARCRELLKPQWRVGLQWIAEPGAAVAGKGDAEVFAAKGAFGAGGENAACARNARSHRFLAAKAVLQQDQLGAGEQAWCQAGDGLFGVVGFAGHQQALDGCVRIEIFSAQWIEATLLRLNQGQAAGLVVGGQACRVAQDQAYWQPGTGQARGPQAAEAAGAEHMPGHDLIGPWASARR